MITLDFEAGCCWSGVGNVKDLSLFLSCLRKVSVALSELAVHGAVVEEKV